MKFIIYAPPYDENIGGVIALHKLCHCINTAGGSAFLYPFIVPIQRSGRGVVRNTAALLRNFLRQPKTRIKNLARFLTEFSNGLTVKEKLEFCYKICLLNPPGVEQFRLNNSFLTSIDLHFDLDETVIVYPDIIDGNPLKGKHIVRWFLHKPGFHTGVINYGRHELYFFYQVKFDDPKINPNPDNRLTVMHIMDEIYYKKNNSSRSGCCYILRKGKDRAVNCNFSNGIIVDEKSHKEIAEIFNRVEYCISYDTDTMYSFYAVLCGCKSVVVPLEGLSKEEWQPQKEYRYGIAYGIDDLEEAENTKDLLLPYLKSEESNTNMGVELFIKKCEMFFGFSVK